MWSDKTITYIHHDFYHDKTQILYKEDGEEKIYDVTKSDFSPFIWLNTKNQGKYNVLTHKDSYRAVKNLGNQYPKNVLLKPDTQFLIQNKASYFKNIALSDLKTMVFDIETTGLKSEDCEILAIGIKTNFDFNGEKSHFLSNNKGERNLLKEFLAFIESYDPELLVGHNVFGFDLPFIVERMKAHGVKPIFGKFGLEIYCQQSPTKVSRLKKGFEFYQYRIPGRYIIDTMHLAILEDVRRNEFESYSLKYLAKHLGIASKDRVYIDGDKIHKMFYDDFDTFCKYLDDDLNETIGLCKLFLPAYLQMTKIIPLDLQTNIYAGVTQKFKALFAGDYYHEKKMIPEAQPKKKFEGAISQTLNIGIFDNVAKYDVSSLYPSIQLTYDIFPKSDTLGVMKKYLSLFKDERLIYKKKAQDIETIDSTLFEEYDAYQLALKILINSFYGVLGTPEFPWNDMDAAAAVTAKGREILHIIMDEIQKNNCIITCVDTDGAYFSYPADVDPNELLKKVNGRLDKGIIVEFEKSWPRMISYKSKTYATLTDKGKLMKKGSAFKNRGLPRFLKEFIESFLYNALSGTLSSYEDEYFLLKRTIADRTLHTKELVRKIDIGFNYNTYINRETNSKIAHFEAMRRANKTEDYKAGDSVHFYYAGDKLEKQKSDMCKLYLDETERDYNIDYYIDSLENWHNIFKSIIHRQTITDDE